MRRISHLSSMPVMGADAVAHRLAERLDIEGAGGVEIEQEIAVLLATPARRRWSGRGTRLRRSASSSNGLPGS